jgi:hypothetical protein
MINGIGDGLAVSSIFIINNEKEGTLVRRKKPSLLWKRQKKFLSSAVIIK